MEKAHTSLAAVLARAHRVLLEDIEQLEQQISTGAANVAKLAAQLKQVQTHLIRHFHLEEHEGYMDAVIQRDPSQDRGGGQG